MSVRRDGAVIHLEGRCLVDDAEALLVMLREDASLSVDVSRVERLHLAVLQVLLALRPALHGATADPILARLLPAIGTGAATA